MIDAWRWIEWAVGIFLIGAFIWPTAAAALTGWARLRAAYPASASDQPLTTTLYHWQSISLAQDFSVLGVPGDSGGDLWPVAAAVGDAGLFLRVQHAVGEYGRPVLLPWSVLEPADAPKEYKLGILVPELRVRLGFRGPLAETISGHQRWFARQPHAAAIPASAAPPGTAA